MASLDDQIKEAMKTAMKAKRADDSTNHPNGSSRECRPVSMKPEAH